MDKLRRALSGDDQDEESGGIIQEVRDSTTLSWSTRIKGFVTLFVIGIIFSVLGSVAVFMSNYKMFAVLYTFGSIISLSSTCFLMGPVKQIKKMFAPTRLIATIVVLITLVLTLLAGLWWKSGPLALLFVAIQFLAMTWYSISYIPYARDAVMKCFQSCV